MYHPRREMTQFSQVPQIKNGKPDFSPTFQKAELHNSTFFQLNLLQFSYSMFCKNVARLAVAREHYRGVTHSYAP